MRAATSQPEREAGAGFTRSRVPAVTGGSPIARVLQLIHACHLGLEEPIIDVSGASSRIMDVLLAEGHTDITVMDRSEAGYRDLLGRCAGQRDRVTILNQDLTEFHPRRRYALWHDAAVFQRLAYPEERWRYVETLEEALRPEGHLVIETFGPEGPEEFEGRPVHRYNSTTLPLELGTQFELAEHALGVYRTAAGQHQQYLHCRFCRHAPASVG